jgi:hypothetical protein
VSAPPGRPGRRFRLPAEWPLLLVLSGVGIGLLVVVAHHFRRGSVLMGAAVLGAALLRLVLPAREAGLLAARGRLADVLTLTALGTGLVVLALSVPRRS